MIADHLSNYCTVDCRNALYQRHAPILHSYGSASADIHLGLQRSLQHVPHALLRRDGRPLLHGELRFLSSDSLLGLPYDIQCPHNICKPESNEFYKKTLRYSMSSQYLQA